VLSLYVDWTTRFILFHGNRHPCDLTNAEVNRVLGLPDLDGNRITFGQTFE